MSHSYDPREVRVTVGGVELDPNMYVQGTYIVQPPKETDMSVAKVVKEYRPQPREVMDLADLRHGLRYSDTLKGFFFYEREGTLWQLVRPASQYIFMDIQYPLNLRDQGRAKWFGDPVDAVEHALDQGHEVYYACNYGRMQAWMRDQQNWSWPSPRC